MLQGGQSTRWKSYTEKEPEPVLEEERAATQILKEYSPGTDELKAKLIQAGEASVLCMFTLFKLARMLAGRHMYTNTYIHIFNVCMGGCVCIFVSTWLYACMCICNAN